MIHGAWSLDGKKGQMRGGVPWRGKSKSRAEERTGTNSQVSSRSRLSSSLKAARLDYHFRLGQVRLTSATFKSNHARTCMDVNPWASRPLSSQQPAASSQQPAGVITA